MLRCRPNATRCASASTGPPPTSTRRFAVVDLDAFDANAAALGDRAAGKPIRVASKSVRCRALLDRALARPGWHGVMAYTLAEALWLVRTGVTDDVLVGVPDRRPRALAELAADAELAAADHR